MPRPRRRDVMAASRTLTALVALAGSLAWCGAADAAEQERPKAHSVAAEPASTRRARCTGCFCGSGYRKLWATPIEVEVLDLDTLRRAGSPPKKKGGGKQTQVAHVRGADGREWKFRSIDKDPTPVLPKALQTRLRRTTSPRTRSARRCPANALVVDALAECGRHPHRAAPRWWCCRTTRASASSARSSRACWARSRRTRRPRRR